MNLRDKNIGHSTDGMKDYQLFPFKDDQSLSLKIIKNPRRINEEVKRYAFHFLSYILNNYDGNSNRITTSYCLDASMRL